MKKKMKLRRMILITTILISNTLVLILGGVSGHEFEEMLTERTVADYQETVHALQNNLETLITYVQDFTKYMSLNDDVLDTIEEYQSKEGKISILDGMKMKQDWDALSTQLIFSTSMIYSLEIYSEDKMIYSYYDDPSVSDAKNVPDDILKQALSQSKPIWTDLLTLKQYRSYAKKQDYGFAVVKSVRNEYSKKVGAVAMYVRESSFSDILESANKKQMGRFYLVNGENKILSAEDKTELYQDIRKRLSLSEEEYESCIRKGVLLKEQRGKDPLLYISRDIGEKGVRLVCETTMKEFGRQQRESKIFIGILMLVSAILATISAWFVSGKITKPLGQLMGIMEQIQEDEKSIHQRFPEGDTGEIGILGHRFNELMDKLDASMQQIYEEQRQRRHNEVRLLQAQIVPHFLYNTMGIISSFIRLGMTEKALTTIQNLVSFYRISLSSGKDIITVKEEIELTRNYMELQSLRYIEYVEYHMECDKETEKVWIPKLTIQPLLENVLQHGLKPSVGKCQIRVNVTTDEADKKLRISVWDNGTGIEKERLEQIRQSLETGKSLTKSFGVLNINQRLKLMYGEKYNMKIDSVEGEYTQFILALPLERIL